MKASDIKVGDIVKFSESYLNVNGYEEEDIRFLVLDVKDGAGAWYKDLCVQIVAPVDCLAYESIWWEDDIDLILA